MARSTITTAIFLVLVVADVSPASSFWKLRYLADKSPAKDNTTAAAPANSSSPSPLSGAKKSNPKADSPSKLDPNSLNQTNSATPPPDSKKDSNASPELEKVSPPPQKEINGGNNSSSSSNSTNDKPMENTEKKKKKENVDSGKNTISTQTGKGVETKEEKNTNGDKIESKSGIVEICDGVANKCTDGEFLSACVKGFGTGSNKLVVLVQNSGGNILEVSLSGPFDESKKVEVPKNGTEKISISLTISKSSKFVLSAGKGDCVLLVNPPVSEGNFIFNLPSYDKLATPVNGAYFLIVTVVIFGASWACCMCRKRRRHDGIPYQELEMGLPESMAAAEAVTAEGWDQVWDDDWDDDKAVKSPAARHVPNISANGLTARSANRDGWENDWDD